MRKSILGLLFFSLGATSCKLRKSDESEVKIINGIENRENSVFWTFTIHPGLAGASCSATKIGPKTFITAAHCINSAHVAGFKTLLRNSYSGLSYRDAFSSNAIVHSSYHFNPSNPANSGIDLAIFETENDFPWPNAFITSQPPLANQTSPIYVFGAGCTQWNTAPDLKTRFAEGRVTSVIGDYFTAVNSKGASGLGCQGDSGGGAFRKIGEPWELLGVFSYANDGKNKQSGFVRLDTPAIHKWITSKVGGSVKYFSESTSSNVVNPVVASTPEKESLPPLPKEIKKTIPPLPYGQENSKHRLIGADTWQQVSGFTQEFKSIACLVDKGLNEVIITPCLKSYVDTMNIEADEVSVDLTKSTVFQVERNESVGSSFEARLIYHQRTVGYIYYAAPTIRGIRSFKVCYAANLSSTCKSGIGDENIDRITDTEFIIFIQ